MDERPRLLLELVAEPGNQWPWVAARMFLKRLLRTYGWRCVKVVEMPKARMVKPGILTNEDLAQCEPLARWLWIGLWMVADREGRLEDRPSRIKVECLPYDECRIDDLLEQLANRGFIRRYLASGIKVIEIPNFIKHQHIHQHESKSQLPREGETSNDMECPDITGNGSTNCLLITNTITNTSTNTKTPLPPKGETESFALFWEAYPRKQSKAAAFKAWKKLCPDHSLASLIVKAVERQRTWEQWQRDGGRFIPHAATWLTQRLWEDESGGETKRETDEERLRRVLNGQ